MAGMNDFMALKSNTVIERLVYVLFVGCALALGLVTVGVLYLSLQRWKNTAEEKKELAKFDADPECASCVCCRLATLRTAGWHGWMLSMHYCDYCCMHKTVCVAC